MLQNLRIGLRKRRNGKSDGPVKQRGGWLKASSNKRRKIKLHSSHLRRLGVYLRHQPLNKRKDILLTLERRCTWSAKRTWIPLNWKPWRHREVRRRLQQPMVKCRRVRMLQYMSKSWIFLTMKVLEDSPTVYRSESFAMNIDTLTSGSTVENHISFKTVFGYNATRRTSFRSWFLVCHRVLPPTFLLQHQWHLQDRRLIILHLTQARQLHQPQLCQGTVRQEHGKTWVW